MKLGAKLPASLVLALFAMPALAALPTIPTPPSAPSTGSGVAQALFGLVFVIGLIFALGWLARRFGLQRLGGAGGALKIVNSTPVGARERIVTLEIGGTWVVVGVTPTHINALHTLPAQPLPPSSTGVDGSGARLGEQFSARLRQALGVRGPQS